MSKLEELLKKHCPDGVEYKLFSDVAVYIRGVTYSKSKEINNNYEKEFWQILRANNIDLHSNTLNFDDIKKINKDVKINENQFLYANDIIICAGSGSKEHIGKVAFIYNDIPYSFGGFMGVIRTNESILLSRYLFHILTSSIFKNHLNFNMYSTTINNLSSQIMNSLKIPIPPIEVQKEIVRILDEFTEKTTKLQELLHRETILRKKQYEYYRDKLLTFGEDVEWKILNEVIISLNTGLNPRQFFRLNTDDAKNYYVTIRELQNNTIKFSEKTDKINDEALKLCNRRSNLEVGDVLFSGTGTIGETAIIDKFPNNWNIKEGIYSIKPNKSFLVPKFLMYLLKSSYIRDMYLAKADGGTVKSVPMKEMRNLKIPVPPLEEQERIVKILDQFDTLCNDITRGLPAEIELRKKQYEYYRDKLLTFKEKKK